MALTANQIVSAINGSITAVYPDVEPVAQEELLRNNLTMMLLQGKRIMAEAEATLVRTEAQTAAQQAEAAAQAATQVANAANNEFLAFVASLANQA